MYSKITIELSDETAANLILQELSVGYNSLRRDHLERSRGGELAVFHHDRDQDLAELSRRADAYRLVMEDFVVPGQPLPIDQD